MPAITLFLVPLDQPGITVKAIWTMGDERTNEVLSRRCLRADDYVVGELTTDSSTSPKPSTSNAFTMFTFSPIAQRLDVLCDYVATHPRRKAVAPRPLVRQRIAELATEARWPGSSTRLRNKSSKAAPPPRRRPRPTSSYATELSKRLASASMESAGPVRSCG